MDTKIDFKIQTDYEVIGQGGMINCPRLIGEWWVTPAQSYQGKIPPEIQQKMFEFLNSGEPVSGFLIAEDIREVKPEKKEVKKVVETGLGVVGTILRGLATGMIYLFSAILSFDPMLIAVLPDGRWICLGTWYD